MKEALMKKESLLVILSFLMVCITSTVLSQQKGKYGLTMTNANAIGGAYYIQDNLRLNAQVGFQSISGSGSSTDLSLGVGLWYTLAKLDNLTTFAGGGIGIGSTSGGGVSSSSLSLMGQYGLQYWISPSIGVNGYIGLGYGSSGPSGAKLSTLSTISGIGLDWILN
jgi:hypothetical protein